MTRASLGCLARLAQAGLALECLAPPGRLGIAAALAAALPDAAVVVDHCGLPPGPHEDAGPWRQAMVGLAGFANASCKLSGLIEPFGPGAGLPDVEPRTTLCLDLFGSRRLMAASNHPVTLLGGGTARWSELLARLVAAAGLSEGERSELFGGTARRMFPRARRAGSSAGGACAGP